MNLIDAHCHIDLYPNPHVITNESEELGIITIGMTVLPSHFGMGIEHVSHFHNVHLALGMHPLHAELHESEFNNFIKYIDKTSFIGEIGLDFSYEGINTKNLQLDSFNKILNIVSNKNKILSLHSRKAEKDVLRLLIENKIENAIFHWYSGSKMLIKDIIEKGYYFSINPAMIKSTNGKNIINVIPKNRLLTESDGPFIKIGNNISKPKDVKFVIEYLVRIWGISFDEVVKQIDENFSQLIKYIKK